jgi:hypothetical protein
MLNTMDETTIQNLIYDHFGDEGVNTARNPDGSRACKGEERYVRDGYDMVIYNPHTHCLSIRIGSQTITKNLKEYET